MEALSDLTNGTTNGTTNGSDPDSGIVKICVFCGASPGNATDGEEDSAHMKAARQLATVMAHNNIHLVYGGGTVGLMGEIAKTLVSISGPNSVHGIIPAPLVKYERGPDSDNAENGDLPDEKIYGKTTVVKDMHTRKMMMSNEVLRGAPGSGFIALSGGFGTLEEIMEMVTWNQLGIHTKGCVLLNIAGFWNGLLQYVDTAVAQGFIREGNKAILQEAGTAEQAIDALRKYKVAPTRFQLAWGTQ